MNRKGFTLVETLAATFIAIIVFTVVAIAQYTGVGAALSSADMAQQTTKARNALQRVVHEVGNAHPDMIYIEPCDTDECLGDKFYYKVPIADSSPVDGKTYTPTGKTKYGAYRSNGFASQGCTYLLYVNMSGELKRATLCATEGSVAGGDPVCGDGVCVGDENTCTCPHDCGVVCGDGCCGSGYEDRITCEQDCWIIGDGFCDSPWENVEPDCEISCFLAGTRITMADGSTKPIEKIVVGDTVLSFDEEKHIMQADVVTETFKHTSEGYLIINGHLRVTSNHPMYSNGRWTEAGLLKKGDPLLNHQGEIEIVKSIEKRQGSIDTYNIEVNPYHTYIANNYVVHNKETCFLGDTLISMADGSTKFMKDIVKGDHVLSFDEESGTVKPDVVTAVFAHSSPEYLIINGSLKVTPNHPVLSNKDWEEIGRLEIGDTILAEDGNPIPIQSIERITKRVMTYSMEVNPLHTYIAQGFVVHNAKVDPIISMPGGLETLFLENVFSADYSKMLSFISDVDAAVLDEEKTIAYGVSNLDIVDSNTNDAIINVKIEVNPGSQSSSRNMIKRNTNLATDIVLNNTGETITYAECGDGFCDSITEDAENCPDDCDNEPCGNGICDPDLDETPITCPADCGMCGNGTCDDTLEDCETCSEDCGECYCGDGNCSSGETCDGCETDCGVCPAVCGDGTCNGDENCDTCEQDCGACCGDGICNFGETCGKCADCSPCCGDGKCDAGEDKTCSADCGGGGSCFLAGTLITMADGSQKPIEMITTGEQVLAFDEKTGTLQPDTVTEIFEHISQSYLIVNGTLKVTPNHPVLSSNKWVEIGALNIGDSLVLANGEAIVITSIEKIDQPIATYNIEVNPYHTYIANGYVVHNKIPDPTND